MQNGISGKGLPEGFPYKAIIETLCVKHNFFPCVVGAIKINETGLGQGPTTENDVSGDGGHGIMQLTSYVPPDWQNPTVNIECAITKFLLPDYAVWTSPPYSLSGEELVKALAASYNAGFDNALAGHKQGNVDLYTTHNYGQRALSNEIALTQGTIPQ